MLLVLFIIIITGFTYRLNVTLERLLEHQSYSANNMKQVFELQNTILIS